MEPISVMIADPDEVKRTACEYLLRYEQDMQVVAQAGTGKELLAAALAHKPRVLVCRFTLAAPSGFALLETLRGEYPTPLVLLLTDASVPEEKVIEALMLGARGCLNIDDAGSQLVKAIRSLVQGEVWVSRLTLGRLLEQATRACLA